MNTVDILTPRIGPLPLWVTRRGDYTGGEHGDIGQRTRVTAQPCGLRAYIHRGLLDRSPVPDRRRARDRAGEVNKERDHASRAIEIPKVL